MFPPGMTHLESNTPEALQALVDLHGLRDLSPTLSFLEQPGRNPAILYQQWVEEAQQGADQVVHAEGSAAQQLLGSIALPLLL